MASRCFFVVASSFGVCVAAGLPLRVERAEPAMRTVEVVVEAMGETAAVGYGSADDYEDYGLGSVDDYEYYGLGGVDDYEDYGLASVDYFYDYYYGSQLGIKMPSWVKKDVNGVRKLAGEAKNGAEKGLEEVKHGVEKVAGQASDALQTFACKSACPEVVTKIEDRLSKKATKALEGDVCLTEDAGAAGICEAIVLGPENIPAQPLVAGCIAMFAEGCKIVADKLAKKGKVDPKKICATISQGKCGGSSGTAPPSQNGKSEAKAQMLGATMNSYDDYSYDNYYGYGLGSTDDYQYGLGNAYYDYDYYGLGKKMADKLKDGVKGAKKTIGKGYETAKKAIKSIDKEKVLDAANKGLDIANKGADAMNTPTGQRAMKMLPGGEKASGLVNGAVSTVNQAADDAKTVHKAFQ